MRPLKLKMSAFGPYSGTTEIDFEIIGESGIYLITGDTGAGKTTIFDAISYALFGSASGDSRKENMLRSKYADDSVKTEVELDFIYNRKQYHIRRNPSYMRLSKRGDKMIKETAAVELILPGDSSPVTRIREADEKIVEILGVNKEQFSQIAMIAQGDFKRFLDADTSRRSAIFREIFNTRLYNVLEDKLKERARAASTKVRDANNSVRQYIQSVECDENDSLYIDLERVQSENTLFDEVLELVDEIIEKDSLKYEKQKNEEEALNKKHTVLEKRLGEAEKIEKKKNEHKKLIAGLDENTVKLEELEKQIQELDDKEEEIASLQKSIIRQQQELPKYREYDEKKKMYDSHSSELESISKKKDDSEKRINSLKSKIESDEKLLKEFKDIDSELETLRINMRDIESKIKVKNETMKLLREIKKAETVYGDMQTLYKQARIRSADDRDKYERMHQKYLDEQAGILALSLVDGNPCPVCGSEIHPHKAEISEGAPTKEQLQKFKLQSEKSSSECEDLSVKAGQCRGKVESLTEERDKKLWEIFDEIPYDISLKMREYSNELDETKTATDIKIRQVLERKDERDRLNGTLPKMRKEFEEVQNEHVKLSADISAMSVTVKHDREDIEALKTGLKYESEEQAAIEIRKLEKRVSSYENDVKSANKKRDELRNSISLMTGQIRELKKDIEENDVINIDEIKGKKKLIEDEIRSIKQQYLKINARIVNNSSIRKEMIKKSEELKKLEEESSFISLLSDTAGGNLTGKEKIRLETYVQMTYFDMILQKANVRFSKMTNNQYEFVRRTEADGKRSQFGLDLDVIDYYNRSQRSAGSLSGGESFKASLSLALGLADVVQSSSGGIKLDTMFIDEGFGSLDSESLLNAIKILHELAGDTRLVGIISHVDVLKEKIEKQIRVTKDRSGGSKIEIAEI